LRPRLRRVEYAAQAAKGKAEGEEGGGEAEEESEEINLGYYLSPSGAVLLLLPM
jgi:hypothetical protein